MEPGNDIYNLLMGDTAESQASAKALAELLRFKKGAALVGAQAMDPAKQAGFIQGQAAGEQKDLFTGLEKRMQYGQEKQAQQERMAHDAEQSRLNRSLQTEQLRGQHALARAMLMNNPNRLQQMDDGVYTMDQHSGQFSKVAGSTGRQAALDAKASGKELGDATNDLKEFGKRIDPMLQSSRSGLGASGIINLRGHRVYRVFPSTKDEDLNKIPPVLIKEATQGIASMVNGGYAPTITAIRELSPNTIGMTAAEIATWITNQPQDANQAKFLKVLLGVVERENRHAKAVQADTFLRQVNAFPRVTKHYGKNVRDMAKTLGIDQYLDDDFQPKPGVLEALSQPGKTLPEELTIRLWNPKKPNEKPYDIPAINTKDIAEAKAEGYQEMR